MSAYTSASYYMLGVLYCFIAFVATVLADRLSAWWELTAMYAVVWPLLGAWRNAA